MRVSSVVPLLLATDLGLLVAANVELAALDLRGGTSQGEAKLVHVNLAVHILMPAVT